MSLVFKRTVAIVLQAGLIVSPILFRWWIKDLSKAEEELMAKQEEK